ncbi:cupin domain-containing protein [Myxococcota bacterium]|nr:cupin domain-containing protein [Myxococcota bacterium]MBU1429087.1 cupin domain-containing protein [Myxococcota bacterium]MBU1900074.1 cupin domain-containing protein [Myxococcota bacterium]
MSKARAGRCAPRVECGRAATAGRGEGEPEGFVRTGGKAPLVRYTDETAPTPCPYGTTTRVVTGGEGGVANVHIIDVSEGGLHLHEAYDETYYVLDGSGEITLDGARHALRPGAVVIIPAGVPHALKAAPGQTLRFVIFGTPALPISDERARPKKVSPPSGDATAPRP